MNGDSPRITVSIQCGGPELIDAIADEWRALLVDPIHREPFYQPEWVALHVRMVEPKAALRLVTARRDAHLVGVLALVADRARLAGVPVRRLRAATDQVSPDRVDLLARPEDRDVVAAAVWRALKAEPGWDVIDCAAVPEHGGFDALLAAANRDGRRVIRTTARQVPILDLPPPGSALEEAIPHASGKFRANLRRRKRKLEEIGPVAFTEGRSAEPDCLDAFFALEAAGWKGRGGSAIAVDPGERAYYEALARVAAERGYFALHSLECGGRPVAMAFGFVFEGQVFGQKIAYDESLSALAPGHLLVAEIVRAAIAQGRTRLDFLGESSAWKREWTAAARDFSRCLIFNRTLPAAAARISHRQLIPFAKRLRTRWRRTTAGSTNFPQGTA